MRVARRTPPKTASRCQVGMEAGLVERQGFPAREALFEAVPEADLVLADLPAEQDFLAVRPQRREVDQAAVEILHLHPELLQQGHSSSDRLGLPLELALQLTGLLWVEVAAVAGDSRCELRAL